MSGGAAAAAATAAGGARAAAASEPGRWQESMVVALAPTIAVLISVTVGLPTFIAPTVAYFAMQRITVSSWHNLPRRLAIIAATGLLLVPYGGFLLQQPWFLLPAFFLTVTGTLYFFPLPRAPIEGSSILFVVAVFTYAGLFAPGEIAVSARNLAVEAALGVVVATVVSEAFRSIGPRRRLADALAASFARHRERCRVAIDRYRSPAAALGGESEVFSPLSTHLQLLDQARQEGLSHEDDRVLVALATATERLESYVATLDHVARRETGRTYRALLDDDLTRIGAAIDRALGEFAAASARLGDPGASVPAPAEPWPDLGERVRDLEAHQLALRRSGALAIDAVEAVQTNTFVRTLAGIANVLHVGPAELAHMARGAAEAPPERRAPARAWPRLPPLRPFDLRYALHGGLGATLCLIVGVASNLPALSTILFNPVLVAQSSYGATLRRAGLRMLGVLGGALLGLAAIAAVTPNTMDVAVYVALCFAVATVCQYVALASAANWYASFQVAISFFVVTYSLAPSADVETALWRAWGTVLGTALLFTVYGIVAPDYAGRQLVARFADLLRATLALLPEPGRRVPSPDERLDLHLTAGRAGADALRLADEARFERRQGIDAAAAVEATGIATRLAYRAGLIARGRETAPPPQLAAPLAEGLATLEREVASWVRILIEVVEARDTMSRPGALSHERARERAARALTRPRPDVAARAREIAAYFDRTHLADLAALEPRVSGEVLAGLEHYRRMGELLPRLDRQIARALLPGHPIGADAEAEAAAEPPAAG